MLARRSMIAIAAIAALAPRVASPREPRMGGSKTTRIFDHLLPNVPGKSMKCVLVDYAPGASSPSHAHPPSAFIFAIVLEGAIRSSVNGAPVRVYDEGESFYEEPGAHHGVSALWGRPSGSPPSS